MQQFNVYLTNQMQRLLNLLDKDPSSPTHGCFDRVFWHYKFIKDYPDAMYQTNTFSLAVFYRINFPENIYFSNRAILGCLKAAVDYTIKIQNKNGSWSETYPNEYSLVATSFVLYNLSKAFLFTRDEFSETEIYEVKNSVNKARNWLVKDERQIYASNQYAAKIAAIIYADILLDNNNQYAIYKNMINELLAKQNPAEGWFEEYGGFDLGYSSLCLHFLADIYNSLKDRHQKLQSSILKLLKYVEQFITFVYVGNISSRNTTYFLPGGLKLINSNLLEAFLADLSEMRVTGLHHFDDKYFAEYLFSYAECLVSHKEKELVKLNADTDSELISADSAIQTIELDKNKPIKINLTKSGSWVTSDAKMYFNGYLLKYKNSYFASPEAEKYSVKNDGYQIVTSLQKVKHIYPLTCPGIFIIRFYNYTLCKIALVNKFIDKFLRITFFVKKRRGIIRLTRDIIFKKDTVIINDNFSQRFPIGTTVISGFDYASKNTSSSKYNAPVNSQFIFVADKEFFGLKLIFSLNYNDIKIEYIN